MWTRRPCAGFSCDLASTPSCLFVLSSCIRPIPPRRPAKRCPARGASRRAFPTGHPYAFGAPGTLLVRHRSAMDRGGVHGCTRTGGIGEAGRRGDSGRTPRNSTARGMSNNATAGTDSSAGTRRGQQERRHTSAQRRAGHGHAGVHAWARRSGAAAPCLHADSRRSPSRRIPGAERGGRRRPFPGRQRDLELLAWFESPLLNLADHVYDVAWLSNLAPDAYPVPHSTHRYMTARRRNHLARVNAQYAIVGAFPAFSHDKGRCCRKPNHG